MKNTNDYEIQQAREQKLSKTVPIDILVVSGVVQNNKRRLAQAPPRRKRRINYARKIANDPFIFGI